MNMPAFGYLVCHVVTLGPKKEVCRIDAKPVVAMVTDAEAMVSRPLRNWAAMDCVTNAMGALSVSVSYGDTTISTGTHWSMPVPTVLGIPSFNSIPKPLLDESIGDGDLKCRPHASSRAVGYALGLVFDGLETLSAVRAWDDPSAASKGAPALNGTKSSSSVSFPEYVGTRGASGCSIGSGSWLHEPVIVGCAGKSNRRSPRTTIN